MFNGIHLKIACFFDPHFDLYLKNTNNVTYVEKNQINCEWLDGIPNSSLIYTRSTGRGSWIQCLRILLQHSLHMVPMKNVICKTNDQIWLVTVFENHVQRNKSEVSHFTYCVQVSTK